MIYINLELKLQNSQKQHASPSHQVFPFPLPFRILFHLPWHSSVSWHHSGYLHFCRMPSPKRWKKKINQHLFQASRHQFLLLNFFLHRRGENIPFYNKSFLCWLVLDCIVNNNSKYSQIQLERIAQVWRAPYSLKSNDPEILTHRGKNQPTWGCKTVFEYYNPFA